MTKNVSACHFSAPFKYPSLSLQPRPLLITLITFKLYSTNLKMPLQRRLPLTYYTLCFTGSADMLFAGCLHVRRGKVCKSLCFAVCSLVLVFSCFFPEYLNMGKRKTSYKPVRSKFKGNQHQNKRKCDINVPNLESASARKIVTGLKAEDANVNNTDDSVNLKFDVNIMFKEIEKCLRCKCGSNIEMSVNRIVGLGCSVSIVCKKCLDIGSFENCRKLGKNNNVYSINRQAVYATRCIGQGLVGLKVFCGLMNLPPPVVQNTYDMINNRILTAPSEVAMDSKIAAAEEEASLSNSRDISVSCDGTWLTRGHTSQHGVCSVIGAKSGKVIDTYALSQSCKGCQQWKNKTDTVQYHEWLENHEDDCCINHRGTSGSMEVEGMKKIFSRSMDIYKVRYLNYIGDGDTKSFKAVSELHPYGPEVELQKIECVGHIQKRMGTQLRGVKNEWKGKKLKDNKPLSGKNRLTDAIINTLTVYYGNAIRANCTSVNDMRRAIWAVWYHKASTDANPMHNFCPKGNDSWCPYQRAVHEGTLKDYRHKNTLPAVIMEVIKPVFKKLVATELLKKCVGGYTQNNNESFNSKIWKICPKTGFAGTKVVQIAVNDAVMTFNEGMQSRTKVLEKLELVPGKFCQEAMMKQDELRVQSSTKRTLERTKEARVCRERLRLEEEARHAAKKGLVYAPPSCSTRQNISNQNRILTKFTIEILWSDSL
ncbi:uncharacterized protein [Periplaneta americana]|uniref:uncharacterized protein isoform X2 n=1 Tax=Periplaneta americana TaxID=6978 RepID=UPI0037E78AED